MLKCWSGQKLKEKKEVLNLTICPWKHTKFCCVWSSLYWQLHPNQSKLQLLCPTSIEFSLADELVMLFPGTLSAWECSEVMSADGILVLWLWNCDDGHTLPASPVPTCGHVCSFISVTERICSFSPWPLSLCEGSHRAQCRSSQHSLNFSRMFLSQKV